TLIGSSICFFLARSFGKKFAMKIVGESLQKAEGFFKKYGMHAMFVVRLIPFVPFDGISYGAGLVGVPYSTFFLATAVGIIPSTIIYSYLGSFVSGLYWWFLIGALTFSLVGVIVATLLVRKSRTPFEAERVCDTT